MAENSGNRASAWLSESALFWEDRHCQVSSGSPVASPAQIHCSLHAHFQKARLCPLVATFGVGFSWSLFLVIFLVLSEVDSH